MGRENGYSSEPTPTRLEQLGKIQMDLMDIEKQLTALYVQKKTKNKEAESIWEQILVEAREGKTLFNRKA